MQIATPASTHPRPMDKGSWARMEALPADLPAPAPAKQARHQVWTKFSVGSVAASRFGYSSRVSPTPGADGGPALEAVKLLGRDPHAALAAAAVIAGQDQLQPWPGQRILARTLIGLFDTGSGQLYAAPLWDAPGTNDRQRYYPLAFTAATHPDARARFSDDRLLAVVAPDGYIANPARAGLFALAS